MTRCNTVLQLKSKRCLACARCKLWWMTPEWGNTAADLPPETQFLLVEVEEGGPYAVLLPLIDSDTFRGTLRPPRCASPFCMQSVLYKFTVNSVMAPGILPILTEFLLPGKTHYQTSENNPTMPHEHMPAARFYAVWSQILK